MRNFQLARLFDKDTLGEKNSWRTKQMKDSGSLINLLDFP